MHRGGKEIGEIFKKDEIIDLLFEYYQDHILEAVQQLEDLPIVVNDSRGFYTTRVFESYLLEGMALLSEGQNPITIEVAGKNIILNNKPSKIKINRYHL